MKITTTSIAGGAMVEDTYVILSDWSFDRTHDENVRDAITKNAIGAPSDKRARDICEAIGKRFAPNGVDKALATMAKARVPMDVWRPVLLWHTAQRDPLVRDFFVRWLFGQYKDGVVRIRPEDLHPHLRGLHTQGLVKKEWGDATVKRVASSLLRMAVDFGLLKGRGTYEFVTHYLPETSFIYLLHAMFDVRGNGGDVLRADDWSLFMMGTYEVEHTVCHLHQFRKLRFERAGSLVDLSLPYETALDFAEALLRGA